MFDMKDELPQSSSSDNNNNNNNVNINNNAPKQINNSSPQQSQGHRRTESMALKPSVTFKAVTATQAATVNNNSNSNSSSASNNNSSLANNTNNNNSNNTLLISAQDQAQQLYEKHIQDARKRAIALAEQEFQFPSSLQNIDEIRDNIQKQNEILHTQLSTIVTAQIDEAKSSVNMLNEGDKSVAHVQSMYVDFCNFL